MTDFNDIHKAKCKICGRKYVIEEGKDCNCWKCSECGEEFSDYDMLGDEREWLCLYCEDMRCQEETLNASRNEM